MFGLRGLFRRRARAPHVDRRQALCVDSVDETRVPRVDETPVPNAVAEVLDRFMKADERRRVEIWRRNDGFFGFAEEQEFDDEYIGPYWSPIRGSGLYATHEEALRDARAEIPWLRPSLTSPPL